jgi:hypothetical protein
VSWILEHHRVKRDKTCKHSAVCAVNTSRLRHLRCPFYVDVLVIYVCSVRIALVLPPVKYSRTSLFVEHAKREKFPKYQMSTWNVYLSSPEIMKNLLKTLESRENLDHRLYRWSDIEPMVVNGFLKSKLNKRKPGNNASIPFNPEEYTEFGFEQLNNQERDWLEMSQYFLKISLDKTMRVWNNAPFDNYSPILIEVALFNEFHYHFDYSWELKQTHQEQVAEYASVARHWTERDMWGQRPWRLSAFPKTPRCSVSNPCAQQYHRDRDQEAYSEHQKQCKLRRALIRAYPTIVSNPDIWCRCVNASQFDMSVSLAIAARLSNKRTKNHNLDYELLTNLKRDDVLLTRTARNRDLKPVIYERDVEREDITMRKVAIVSIRKDSFEIKLPGPGARVKFRENE